MRHFKNAISALFAACLLIVAAVGMAQAENATAEADAFQHLADKAVAINDSGPMDKTTTRTLGLTTGEEEFIVYQIKVLDGANKHYFNIAKDGSGRTMLFSLLDGMVYIFVLEAQHHPIAAAIRPRNQLAYAVTVDSIRPQLMKVIAFWVDWAAKNTTK